MRGLLPSPKTIPPAARIGDETFVSGRRFMALPRDRERRTCWLGILNARLICRDRGSGGGRCGECRSAAVGQIGPKALPKGNQAPQEQQQPREAKQHAGPRDYLGMEKLVRRHSRPVECRGEQDIEIEQGKWRDQEIRLVYMTEFHRFYALSSQDRDSGQYHPKQQNDC